MNPYVALGLGAAWVASLAAVGGWQNSAGRTAERSTWQAREIKQVNAYAAALQTAQDARAAAERAFAVKLAGIAQKHAQEIEDERLKKELDIAAARAGRIVLRIPAPCPSAGDRAPAATGPAPGDGHGGETAELPREITADLLALADDADAVARQLAACQTVIRADRSGSRPLHPY